MNNFDEYKILGEPHKAERAKLWETAIGLQQADGLRVSDYLIEIAKAHIDGDITIDEVKHRIDGYYRSKTERIDDRTDEADKSSSRITEILGEKTFTFSPMEYITIHKRLFDGSLFRGNKSIAGVIRDYNISKDEWVLGGDTVYYASADSIRATLEYDFAQEKKFSYKGLSQREITEHIAKFTSGIWQIHAFGEGNTRTTAVFIIKYLRSLGYRVENDLFKDNSWYFRNALVRANYNAQASGIFATTECLEKFFGNLLLGEKNILRNRDLHVKANDTTDTQNDTILDTIFSLIKSNTNITTSEIAEQLGLGIATVKRKTKELKDKGWLERVGSIQSGCWKINH